MLIQKIELFYKILRTVRSWAGAVVWGAVCMVIAQAVAAKEEAATNAWRGEVPAARYLIDLDNALLPWMRRYRARVVAVRPDKFVAAADTQGLAVPSL